MADRPQSFRYNGRVTLEILLTNDDGIHAPGIAVLRRALEGLGRVTTIAPDHNSSAVGRSITIDRALHVVPQDFGDGWAGFACDGTPSDCVRIGLLGAVGSAPDLVVSGVNLGANLGADVTYSGTVGAAFEAALRGRPALAFSVESREPGWLAEAEPVIWALVERVIARGLPTQTILNVNLPDCPLGAFAGIRPARLGGASCQDRVLLAPFGEDPEESGDGGAREFYLPCDGSSAGGWVATDFEVLAQRCVAVTPLRYDLLDLDLLRDLAAWELDWERTHG